MAEDTAPDTKQVVAKPAKAAKPKKSEKSAQKPSGGRVWGMLALLVSLVALGAVGYGGYIYYIKQDLFSTDVVAELNRLKSGSARNGERQAEFGKSLESFEQRLNSVKEIQDTLASAIGAVAWSVGAGRIAGDMESRTP